MRDRDNQSERQQIVWWSVSRWGAFTSPMAYLYLLGIGFVAGIVFALVFASLDISPATAHLLFPGGRKVIPIPAVAFVLVFWLYARFAVRRAEKRERAWLAALPYELELYFEALGDDPDYNRPRIELEITWQGERPPDATIEAILGVGWKTTPHGAIVEPGVEPGNKNHDSNRPFRDWFHRLAEAELAALYGKTPFSKLAIINDVAT
jgi:hypothetical protein